MKNETRENLKIFGETFESTAKRDLLVTAVVSTAFIGVGKVLQLIARKDEKPAK